MLFYTAGCIRQQKQADNNENDLNSSPPPDTTTYYQSRSVPVAVAHGRLVQLQPMFYRTFVSRIYPFVLIQHCCSYQDKYSLGLCLTISIGFFDIQARANLNDVFPSAGILISAGHARIHIIHATEIPEDTK